MALLILGVVIMIHEFGHFIAAKACGVRVNEFAIGMGPRLLHWGKGETVYSLRAFPVGGFCAMEGEDEGSPTPAAMGGNADRPASDGSTGEFAPAAPGRAFYEKKVWQRIIIVCAGVFMNLLLGFVLLLVYHGALQKPNADGMVLFSTTTIASVDKESPAYQSGLRPGDTILSVNGRRTLMDTDLILEMQSDEDGILAMTVRRKVDGKEQTVALDAVEFTTAVDEETGRQYLKYDFKVLGIRRTFGNTIVQAAKQEVSVATIVWRSLVDIVRGRYGLNDLSGPVGTVSVITEAVGNATESFVGLQDLVYLIILITVNLGVFNLLPLPALDGSRLVFLIWEGITRKKVPAKFEGMFHFVGLVLLLLLMLVITYSDITKLFV